MMYPLLFALLGLQQNAVEQQQLERMEQTLQQVQQAQRQISELRQSMDQVRTLLANELKPVCSADVRWWPVSSTRPIDPQTPVSYSLLSTVSAPADACLSAEIRITVNYFDAGGFVCSGGASLSQREAIQNFSFEFRPLTVEYFFKWRDGPTWEQSNYHRLICYDREGLEVREPGAQSASVKMFATVLPKRGGLAIAEAEFALPRPIAPPRQNVPSVIPGFR